MLLVSFVSYGQTTKVETKFDVFTSKTGSIIRFVDTKVDGFKSKLTPAEYKIRKVTAGNMDTKYYFLIEGVGDYLKGTAVIEYSDLLEIIKAVKSLKETEISDITSSNYLENKFRTTDGFTIGYYIKDTKSVWYADLEKYGSRNTLFISGNGSDVESVLESVKTKMDEIKK
jgi:hypothetical protein